MTWGIRDGSVRAISPHVAAGLFTGVCLLAGCSSGGSIATGSLSDTITSAFHGLGTAPVTREDVRAVPFASMGYRIADDSEQMLVLAGNDGGDLVWTSSAKITLVTRNGRIVRSMGLQHDLAALTPAKETPNNSEMGAISTWSVRFADPDVVTGHLSCTVARKVPETISILERSFATMRTDESCRSSDLRWRFENRFWIEPHSRLVVRSLQYVHPKLKPVTTEVLRPYVPASAELPAAPAGRS